MVKRPVHPEESDVECVRSVSRQTVGSVNLARIWSSLAGLGKRNSVVKKGGLCAVKNNSPQSNTCPD